MEVLQTEPYHARLSHFPRYACAEVVTLQVRSCSPDSESVCLIPSPTHCAFWVVTRIIATCSTEQVRIAAPLVGHAGACGYSLLPGRWSAGLHQSTPRYPTLPPRQSAPLPPAFAIVTCSQQPDDSHSLDWRRMRCSSTPALACFAVVQVLAVVCYPIPTCCQMGQGQEATASEDARLRWGVLALAL